MAHLIAAGSSVENSAHKPGLSCHPVEQHMQSRIRDDSKSQPIWRTTPPRLIVIFFSLSSSSSPVSDSYYDGTGMGRQSVLHFVLSVVLTGLFAMAYLWRASTFATAGGSAFCRSSFSKMFA